MEDHAKNTVYRWWQSLFLPPEELKTKGIVPAPTAYKAQLKRCESIEAVMLTEGFRSLWLGLGEAIINDAESQDIQCWATIAVTLVHVKNNPPVKLAVAAGRKADGDKSVVSEMRFAQLQTAKTPEDFARRLRRIVQQLKGEVNVIALAEDIEQWFDEFYQFRPRRAEKRIAIKWAMDYYRAASSKAKS